MVQWIQLLASSIVPTAYRAMYHNEIHFSICILTLKLPGFSASTSPRNRGRGTEDQKQQIGNLQARGMPSEKHPWVDELMQCIKQCLKQQNPSDPKPQNVPDQPKRNPKKKQVTCWKCKQPGHIQRNCPESDMPGEAASWDFRVSNNDKSQSQSRPGNYQTRKWHNPASSQAH